MPILLVDNYDSFTYNLYQMVQALTETPVQVVRNDALSFEDVKALRPERVILSPGPGHPATPADIGVCGDILRRWEELRCPVLGVCLGFQAMAQALGGQVIPAPEIMHGKTTPVRKLADSLLLDGLPDPFAVMRYHSWMVDRIRLPETFEPLAETDDAQALLMAMRHKARPWFGVQFHPESIGTPEGGRMLENFLKIPVPVLA